MSYYDDASLVLIPSGVKAAKVYSQKPTNGTGDLTFTRASNATRVASNGLIEKVRTNLALYSEQFDNAAWSKGATTITANAAVSPDGYTNADAIVDTATNAEHNIAVASALTTTTNVAQTISVFLKSGTQPFAMLRNYGAGAEFYFCVVVNLNTGTITKTQAGTNTTATSATITPYGNGWYRVTATCSFASTTNIPILHLVNSATPIIGSFGQNTYLGNGTNSVYAWGFQLENASAYATSYIPTTTAAVSVGPVSGLPRLDYLGSSCPRLLLEPQRTNYQLNSEDFDNWYAPNDGVTLSENTSDTLDPSGYSGATKVTTTGGNQRIYDIVSIPAGSSTYSVFVKAGTGNIFNLFTSNAAFSVSFNLSTQSVTASIGSGTITSYGNGWYRCTATGTTPSGDVIQFLFPNSVGQTTYIWGGQWEAGAYATSYIPTLGASSVTRVADAASKTGISSLIGQTEGTIFWEFAVDVAVASGHESIINIDNGSFSNTIYIIKSTAGQITAEMYNAGVLQATFTLSVQPAGTYKVAIGYANNNTAFFVNGVQVGTTDTSCTIPAMSRIQLGNGVFGASTDRTAQVLLFPTRLTNAQLAELTA